MNDVIGLVFLALFFVGFGVLGAIFLKKRRAERIDALAAELDKPLLESPDDAAAVPRPDAPKPTADALDAAHREALLRRAEEEAAGRARARAEQDAATQASAEAQQKLEAARAAEADAQERARAAQAHAKDLRSALSSTRDGLMGRIGRVIQGGGLDAAVLEELETVLYGADIGAKTAGRLLDAVRKKLAGRDLADIVKVEQCLRAEAHAILSSVASPPLAIAGDKPRVILVLGVNGAGKTTTIGKLAAQLKGAGHKVLLGAGDTFRAAAADQLEVWAERAGVPIVVGAPNADPSSVLFEAVKRAKTEGQDVVLCDTAGRLHTKVNLMEELKKVARTIAKAQPGAPHEVLLVLDATVGQNAIAQAKQFGDAAPLTGIVLTKLDGTAKGGVVLGIVDELKVPVRYIGVGEGIGDLRPFDASAFLEALFASEPRVPAAAQAVPAHRTDAAAV